MSSFLRLAADTWRIMFSMKRIFRQEEYFLGIKGVRWSVDVLEGDDEYFCGSVRRMGVQFFSSVNLELHN